MSIDLRLGGITYHCKTAGPWVSTEVFFKGCYKNCPGCFNQELRSFDNSTKMPVGTLVDFLVENVPYKRVTIGGGEPFIQGVALRTFVEKLKKFDFTIACYSGYTLEELPYLFKPYAADILKTIDILIDGPFIWDLASPIVEGKFVGSSNQRVIDMVKTREEGRVVLYGNGCERVSYSN